MLNTISIKFKLKLYFAPSVKYFTKFFIFLGTKSKNLLFKS